MHYIDVLGTYYPEVTARMMEGDTYEDIEWISGGPIAKEDLDSKILQYHRDMKKKEVNVERERRIVAGIWFMGHYFDTDERSRENMTGAINAIMILGDLPPGFSWRDHNNHGVPVTKEAMVGLGLKAMGYVSDVYKASWDIKSQIDSLTSLDDIHNFNVTVGWPTNNVDGSADPANCPGPIY